MLTVAVASAHGGLLILEQLEAILLPLFLLLVVLVQKVEGLGEEHHRHGQHGAQHKLLRQSHGTIPERELVLLAHGAHGHADQGVDDTGRIVDGMHPLEEDHEVHPSEEAQHEDHHRNTLEDEVSHVVEVERVAPTQQEAYSHLEDAEEHRELHLQRIHEQQLVARPSPRPVQAEGVRPFPAAVGDVVVRNVLPVGIDVEAALEELEADGEEVVVHEAGVQRKDAEAQDHVPSRVEHRHGELERLGVAAKVEADHQQQAAMPDVAVHHPEDERERHDGEERGVSLLVAGNAVGVDHVLERLRVLVRLDVCRGRLRAPAPLWHQHRALRGRVLNLGGEKLFDVFLLRLGVPNVHAEHHVPSAKVQNRVDGLLLDAKEAPLLNPGVAALARRRGELRHLAVHEGLKTFQCFLLFQQVPLEGLVAVGRGGAVGGPFVKVHAHRLADFDHLLVQRRRNPASALKVDDEDRFPRQHTCFRVGQSLVHGEKVGEGVAARRPEERDAQALLVSLGHDTSDVAQPSVEDIVRTDQRRGEIAGVRTLRGAGTREKCESPAGDLDFFQSLRFLRQQRCVVLLELDELRVQQRELLLHGVQFILVVARQKLVHTILRDGATFDLGDLLREEADDAFHLVNTLHVFAVGPAHLTRVHVFELHVQRLADCVDVLASGLRG
mmetsp:Transcript_72760/g.201760  ORF Transcript_72760/g.201760 Transcript_72760/m.201760 type:complete len:667 (-) Transcript_72760:149-2149(-)